MCKTNKQFQSKVWFRYKVWFFVADDLETWYAWKKARMCHILRKEDGPAIPVSAHNPVFLSKILSMVFSISHPIVLSTTLVQDSTLWIDSRCQNQIRNSWSEARISQNTSLPRESDSQIYVKEARYTPQCDKGPWGLTTTLSSVQVLVNLEDDLDEPLSPFLQCRHHACDLSCF